MSTWPRSTKSIPFMTKRAIRATWTRPEISNTWPSSSRTPRRSIWRRCRIQVRVFCIGAIRITVLGNIGEKLELSYETWELIAKSLVKARWELKSNHRRYLRYARPNKFPLTVASRARGAEHRNQPFWLMNLAPCLSGPAWSSPTPVSWKKIQIIAPLRRKHFQL